MVAVVKAPRKNGFDGCAFVEPLDPRRRLDSVACPSMRAKRAGKRVFVIKEGAPEWFETQMVYARDYGIR